MAKTKKPRETNEEKIERLKRELAEAEKPAEQKPEAEKPAEQKPEAEKPAEQKPEAEKPAEQKPEAEKPKKKTADEIAVEKLLAEFEKDEDHFDGSIDCPLAFGGNIGLYGRTNTVKLRVFQNLTPDGRDISTLLRVGAFIKRDIKFVEVIDPATKEPKKTDDGRVVKERQETITNQIEPKDLPADLAPHLRSLDVVWLKVNWRELHSQPDLRVNVYISNWRDAATSEQPLGDLDKGPRLIQGCGRREVAEVKGGRKVKSATIAVIVSSPDLLPEGRRKALLKEGARGKRYLDSIPRIGIVIYPDPVTKFDPFTLFSKVWDEAGQGEEMKSIYENSFGAKVKPHMTKRTQANGKGEQQPIEGASEQTVQKVLSRARLGRQAFATVGDGVKHARRRRNRGDDRDEAANR